LTLLGLKVASFWIVIRRVIGPPTGRKAFRRDADGEGAEGRAGLGDGKAGVVDAQFRRPIWVELAETENVPSEAIVKVFKLIEPRRDRQFGADGTVARWGCPGWRG